MKRCFLSMLILLTLSSAAWARFCGYNTDPEKYLACEEENQREQEYQRYQHRQEEMQEQQVEMQREQIELERQRYQVRQHLGEIRDRRY